MTGLKNNIVILVLSLIPIGMMAQNITLERQVVGTTGVITDGTYSFYYTVGEAVIQTFAPVTPSILELTQGFQQPDENESVTDELGRYNAFSPNGDNVNDTWFIDNIDKYPENTVKIFNRWGVQVADFVNYNNRNNAWDGKHDGGEVPSATYFYLIKASGNTWKGWVEITR